VGILPTLVGKWCLRWVGYGKEVRGGMKARDGFPGMNEIVLVKRRL